MRTVADCTPAPDAFSSCNDLLRREVLRVLMLLLGIFSFIGNIVVIISRLYRNDFNVDTILITNLAVSDLLMSVYMIIIAGADFNYRGRYFRYADAWRSSFLCTFAGAISTLSSECSVFILTLMSVDRAINISNPFATKRLSRKSCKIILAVVWPVMIIIGFLPAMNNISFINIEYFGGNYYGRQSVCLALPLSRSRLPGWEYAITIFLAFNLFSFIVIAISYIVIYISVKQTAAGVNRSRERADEIRIAIKMAMIVLTDFFCWFPIILMGIVSEVGGWELPEEIYVWAATFIIPINSSINPYLFTIAYMCTCDTCCKEKEAVNVIGMQSIAHASETVSPEEHDTNM